MKRNNVSLLNVLLVSAALILAPNCWAHWMGDFVWLDCNENGIQDPGEAGVQGVLVEAVDCTGQVYAHRVTDANGFYMFYNPDFLDHSRFPFGMEADYNTPVISDWVIPDGVTIKLRFTPPVGLGFTTPFATVGAIPDALQNQADYYYRRAFPDENINDSKVDPATGETACFTFNFRTDVNLDAGLIPVPVNTICCDNGVQGGQLLVNTLPSGNIQVTFIQSTSLNDNTYGANASGWPSGHKFSDLTGSDQAGFLFKNDDGTVALQFQLDYISAASKTLYLSGYGSLGVSGGDGKMVIGSAANIVDFSTSLTENLNKAPFLNNVAQYIVNSPAPSDPNYPLWEIRDIYTVEVSKNAFNSSGFGSVTIYVVHNSPSKGPKCENPRLCTTMNDPCGCNPLATCTPAYPFTSSNPKTSIPFNESEVLRAFTVEVVDNCAPVQIRAYYNDEHALLLGARRVTVKTSSGSTTTDLPVTTLSSSPNGAFNPSVGVLTATDTAGRPLFPALFVTDITLDPNSTAGDWQNGGLAFLPSAVFGTWKSATEVRDMTKSPPLITVTTDRDPAKNNWTLKGGDAAPSGLVNQGYGAEVRWDVSALGLLSGHTYRLYFMVHDGDQNKVGGDVGQACATIKIP